MKKPAQRAETVPSQFRQGHVYLMREKALPSDAKPADFTPGHVVIARGETGREHVFKSERVALYQHEGSLFIEVIGDEPVYLEHEEHGEIEIPPGAWQIIEQREQDPEQSAPRRSFPD